MHRVLLSLLLPALALADGGALFRVNCSFCHGMTGQGGRGSNLTSQLVHGDSLDDIKRVIRKGVPGTQMPSFHFEPGEMEDLAKHVRGLSQGSAAAAKPAGDPVKGKAVYDTNRCVACHRIENEGSVYGPDLSRVGAARSLDYLRDSIVAPSKDVPPEYQGVAVTAKDGSRVRGVRINEDTYSVQLRTMGQDFRMFQKDEVQAVARVQESLMPAYGRMSPDDLNHLLAYLYTLRGQSKDGQADKARGVQ